MTLTDVSESSIEREPELSLVLALPHVTENTDIETSRK